MSAASAVFDAAATYEPSVSPGSVALSGTATNLSDIANIEVFDGDTDLGGTGQLTSSTWSLTAALSPGKHTVHAVVSTLSGTPAQVATAPYQLVTGIQNQPYVYQELDLNSAGAVTQVSSYDGAGSLVSQAAVATNGRAASPFSVSIDPTAQSLGATEAFLTGAHSAATNAASIEIFDGSLASVVDPGTGAVRPDATALGYATIKGDGSWSFDAHLSAGTHTFTAVATSIDGQVADAQSAYSLVTGIVGSPYVYQEIDRGPSGETIAATSYAADGTVVNRSVKGGATINGGGSSGQVIRSSEQDVMTGDGSGSTTFLFRRGFGQDEITNFNYADAVKSVTGVEHDVLSLPKSVFQTAAQVMHHTSTALDGDAVIHLGPSDSIKLDGVTKADLLTHPEVFRFHARG